MRELTVLSCAGVERIHPQVYKEFNWRRPRPIWVTAEQARLTAGLFPQSENVSEWVPRRARRSSDVFSVPVCLSITIVRPWLRLKATADKTKPLRKTAPKDASALSAGQIGSGQPGSANTQDFCESWWGWLIEIQEESGTRYFTAVGYILSIGLSQIPPSL